MLHHRPHPQQQQQGFVLVRRRRAAAAAAIKTAAAASTRRRASFVVLFAAVVVAAIILLLAIIAASVTTVDSFTFIPTITHRTTKTRPITRRTNLPLRSQEDGLSSSLTTTKATATASNGEDSIKNKAVVDATTNTMKSDEDDDPSSVLSFTDPSRWDNFDYLQHWYPVCWVNDMPRSAAASKDGSIFPTKITLFDVDYAVSYNPQTQQVSAFIDKCPHRSAALSEGRVTSNGQNLQCAYHGWSFDTTTGACVDIPQSSKSQQQKQKQQRQHSSSTSSSTTPSSSKFSKSCNAQIVASCVHQNMVWIWPGRIEDSLLVEPPTIPEMNLPDYVSSPTIRDFPMIDWTILISNIMDPDHGLFAHQNTGFDWYSASSKHKLRIEESFDDDGKWIMRSSVDAVEKLLEVAPTSNQKEKEKKKKKKKGKDKKDEPSSDSSTVLSATTTFYAPSVVVLTRRNSNNETKFLTCFWVCPTGTGKSRFMAASVMKNSMPIRVPRWIQHIGLNKFLDQDTILVASQQPPTLLAEANQAEEEDSSSGNGVRQSLYRYQSPTDRTVRLIDAFWDSTLSSTRKKGPPPNRVDRLLELKRSGHLRRFDLGDDRSIVLDRAKQHLDICQDSQDVVRNCKRIITGCCTFTAMWVATRLISLLLPPASTTVSSFVSRVLFSSQLSRKLLSVLRMPVWPIMVSLTAWVANTIRQQFYYRYTKSKLQRDLNKIPIKIWADP